MRRRAIWLWPALWPALWLALGLIPAAVAAQSRDVAPGDLTLWVEVEDTPHVPLVREMVLITIHGIYRRHITRESLVQPDFDGFSWSQLGDDVWRSERIDGVQVKTFRRRMAIYPDRAGALTIGAFTHQLTLTDDEDDWFPHEIRSAPVTLDVAPAPATQGWWFPVKSLQISDAWSNAPDQLAPGAGVLRVIRVEALGVTPEMLPPMPELTSPSAMIFPHPEQRFAELTPFGPVSYAFWRWTIRPGNDVSGIVEPISFEYFDTQNRVARVATISAQRVAYGTPLAGAGIAGATTAGVAAQAALPGWPLALLGAAVFAAGLVLALAGRRIAGWRALQRFAPFDPLTRRLRRAAREGHVAGTRRAAADMVQRDGTDPGRSALLGELDRAIFGRTPPSRDLPAFARRFLAANRRA